VEKIKWFFKEGVVRICEKDVMLCMLVLCYYGYNNYNTYGLFFECG